MATILGVDIGTHSVKLALVEGRLGRGGTLAYKVAPILQDTESLPTEAARFEALGALLRDLPQTEGATCAAGFPADRASLRGIRLPFTDRAQIQKTLAFELEGHVPFDLDDFVLDYRVLKPVGDGSRVLCALASKQVLGDMLGGLKELGLQPRRVVLDAEVLASFAPGMGHRMVVDIGHTRTLVAFVSGGEVIQARALSLGGRDLTLALCRAFDWDWEVAEEEKHMAALPKFTGGVAVVEATEAPDADGATDPGMVPGRVLEEALVPLLSELRATRLAFEASTDVEIEDLVLTGGSSELQGLTPRVAAVLGVPVRRASISDEAVFEGDPGRFALSHALSEVARGLTHSREFQFRKGEFGYKGDLAIVRDLAGYAAAGGVGLLAVGLVLFALKWVGLSQEISALDDQVIAEVTAIVPDMPESIAQDAELSRDFLLELAGTEAERVDILEGAMQGEPPMLVLLKEISQAFPPPKDVRVEVREMTLSPTSVRMKAETTGYEAAASIEQSLQRRARFKDTVKGDEKKLGDGISFSLTIPLDGEQKEEG
jgi:Tfp pilus assembly PilM family ATPase